LANSSAPLKVSHSLSEMGVKAGAAKLVLLLRADCCQWHSINRTFSFKMTEVDKIVKR
jgi:hypothetical protein